MALPPVFAIRRRKREFESRRGRHPNLAPDLRLYLSPCRRPSRPHRRFATLWQQDLSIGNSSGGSGSLGSRRVERVGDLVEAVAEEVPGDVHRHRGARMAEHMLHDFHVRAAGDGEAGGGVAQLVRVQLRDAAAAATWKAARKIGARSGPPPRTPLNTSSSGSLPAMWSHNSATRNHGIGTCRRS
jgi:hypothetical protein